MYRNSFSKVLKAKTASKSARRNVGVHDYVLRAVTGHESTGTLMHRHNPAFIKSLFLHETSRKPTMNSILKLEE